MDHDEHFNGRWGTETELGNDLRRQGTKNAKTRSTSGQEADLAAERQRIEASTKAWSEAVNRPLAPTVSWVDTPSSSGGGGSGSGCSAPPPRTQTGDTSATCPAAADITGHLLANACANFVLAPFRSVWSLLKFAVKAAFSPRGLRGRTFLYPHEGKGSAISSTRAEIPPSIHERPALGRQAVRRPKRNRAKAAAHQVPLDEAPTAARPTDEPAARSVR